MSLRRGGGKGIVGALAVLVLVAGACGNDWGETDAADQGDTGGGGDGGQDIDTGEYVPVDAPGVTRDEIRVGGVASVTNPLGGDYAAAFDGVNAYFDMVNADGGLYGRRLVLAEERDDAVANNSTEVQRLVTEGDTFAVLPVASLLFTGAETLVRERVPTFGWTINTEWQGTADDPRANLFGHAGSFLCFDCARPELAWVAQHLEARRVGVLAYAVPQSSECAQGVRASFERYGDAVDAEVVYADLSLAYGVADLSVQMSRMKDEGVDLITTCMDSNGVVTVAREAKRQGLDAVQYLPNAYNQDFVEEYGDLLEGSLVRTDFVQWQVEDEPPGLADFLEWMERRGAEPTENAMVGWLNADLFVTGLREAGPRFSRQALVDAINRMTHYTADGLLAGVDWTRAHREPGRCVFYSTIEDSAFVPYDGGGDPGDPFVCAAERDGEIVDVPTEDMTEAMAGDTAEDMAGDEAEDADG